MKKKLLYIAWSLLTLACSTEKSEDVGGTAPMRITTNGIATRVATNGDQFEAGDAISLSLYDLNDNLYNTVNEDENWFWYTYDGSGWNGETYRETPLLTEDYVRVYALYPGTDGDLMEYGQHIYIKPQNNVQQEYLLAVSDGTNNNRKPVVDLQFHYMLSLVTVNLIKSQENAEEKINVSSVSLKNAENSTAISTSGYLDVKTGVINHYGADYITLSVDKDLDVEKPVSTQFLVIPTETSDGVLLAVTIGHKEYKVRVPSTTWEKGKQYTYNVTVNTTAERVLSISEATITPRENTEMGTLYTGDKMLPGIGGTIGTPVDLGLSVKWADHNVGASSESGVSGRYLWGDPTGIATKSNYIQPAITEISGTQYDIATMQWGSNWRLPTYEEITELIENTSQEWTSRHGIYGGLFTSNKPGFTNSSIFIPRFDRYGGENLWVWSGSVPVDLDDWYGAYCLGWLWNDGFARVLSSNFDSECNVRPVYVSN